MTPKIPVQIDAVAGKGAQVWKEFKAFAVKGNAIDLAVGVIIGAAFGGVVKSLVDDLIMPPIGRILGNLDFSNFYLSLSEKVPPGLALAEAKKLGPVFAWGNFVTVMINFFFVGFAIFLLVRGMAKLKRPDPGTPPTSKDCPHCLMTIPIKATRCPHCTSELAPASTVVTS